MMNKQRQEPDGVGGPTYARIHDDIESSITLGNLLPGQRVPTARELADQYSTSVSTAGAALRALRQGGRIRSTSTGCYVADQETATAPQERLDASTIGQPIMRPGESALITHTELDPNPTELVLSQLGLAPGSSVICREYVITNHRGEPIGAGASHVDGEMADRVPALLRPMPIPGGIISAIREATGLRVVDTPSVIEVRQPDRRERLGLNLSEQYTGDVLAIDTRCVTADGRVVEYARIVHPRGVVVSMRHG